MIHKNVQTVSSLWEGSRDTKWLINLFIYCPNPPSKLISGQEWKLRIPHFRAMLCFEGLQAKWHKTPLSPTFSPPRANGSYLEDPGHVSHIACCDCEPVFTHPSGLGPWGSFKAAEENIAWTKSSGMDTQGLLQVQKPRVSFAVTIWAGKFKNMPTFLYKFIFPSSSCMIHSDIFLLHTFPIPFQFIWTMFLSSLFQRMFCHFTSAEEKKEKLLKSNEKES